MRPLYGDEPAKLLALELTNCDEWGFTDKKRLIREKYLSRRGKLNLFTEDQEQRFTQ